MPGIHQLVVTAVPGDAVTGTTLTAQRVLRTKGPSHVGARYWDHALARHVVPIDRLAAAAEPGDVLIYHASIGEPGMVEFVAGWDGPVILQYHNMTPARFFHGIDEATEARLIDGRVQLAALVPHVDAAIADSAFNAEELELLGYRDVRVIPLLLDLDALLDVEPAEGTLNHFQVHEGPVLLFVGQLLPHKRVDAILRAYDLLVTCHRPDAHLVIVGAPTVEAYGRHLFRLVSELSLPRCWVAGRVSGAELAAFYRSATAVVTTSEHEGVCLPLIEAMAFGVPVIARANAAIPETLGAAGLLLPPDDDPALLCEAMLHVIEDRAAHAALVEAGYSRLRELAPEKAADRLLAVLAELSQ